MACLWGASVFSFIALFALLAVYGERKISAYIHDRLGPTVTGPKGLFQTFADILKLLSKENIMPDAAEKVLFIIAPLLVFLPVFIGFSVLPVGKGFGVAFPNSGVLFLVAVVSIEVIGIWIAGWASGNKYALLGSARAIAQMVSYEIPALLAILSAVIMYGTFDLEKICQAQYSQSGILSFGVFKTSKRVSSLEPISLPSSFVPITILRNVFLSHIPVSSPKSRKRIRMRKMLVSCPSNPWSSSSR